MTDAAPWKPIPPDWTERKLQPLRFCNATGGPTAGSTTGVKTVWPVVFVETAAFLDPHEVIHAMWGADADGPFGAWCADEGICLHSCCLRLAQVVGDRDQICLAQTRTVRHMQALSQIWRATKVQQTVCLFPF